MHAVVMRGVPMSEKKLYRSQTDSVFCGVCGGIGKYLGIDPTVIRVIWAIVGLFAGAGILAYIAAVIIIPKEPD